MSGLERKIRRAREQRDWKARHREAMAYALTHRDVPVVVPSSVEVMRTRDRGGYPSKFGLPVGERGWLSHPRGEPNRPDRGKRDGACNRTACQDSLLGMRRWSMSGIFTSGERLYYCETCRMDFHEWDVQSGDPVRCHIHPGDET